MPFRKRKEPKTIIEQSQVKILRAATIELNREVKKKLTYQYLGIWSGTLRNTTGAILDKYRIYFGTDTGYGLGYETGNWSKAGQYGAKSYLRKNGYTGQSYYQYRKQNGRRASWSGDKKKRPFLRDTIEDKTVMAKINARLKNAR